MRLIFKKTGQKKFLKKYKKITGLKWMEISKKFKVNYFTLENWVKERRSLPESIFNRILAERSSLKSYKKFIIDKREDNWGQLKASYAGWKSVSEKLKSDILFRNEWIRKCKRGGINNIKKGLIKNWEIGFRNIGRRKSIGPKKERMFNKKEKELAYFLFRSGINYIYENKIILDGKIYFPDFTVGNTLIERCGLMSKFYVEDLNKKLNYYKIFWKGEVILIIPQKRISWFEKKVPLVKEFKVVREGDFGGLNRILGL